VAPPAPHLEYGSAAEALAARHLAGQGLELLTRNFRCRTGELDLVMSERLAPDRVVLVIVEVRSRRRATVATPGATIYRSKRRRLIGATRYFLLRHRQFARWPVRFDVVEITGELADPAIRWTRAAFSVDDVACR
jgi:putative endonuclease